MNFFYGKYLLFSLACSLVPAMAAAQQVFYNEQPVRFEKQRSTHFDEKTLRERMSADGLPEPVIKKLVEQHRQMWANGMHVEWSRAQQTARNGPGNPSTCAVCSDMSAESGWGSWQGATGGNSGGNPPVWGALGTPGAPNFNLNSGAGNDLCTPGFNVGDPTLPLVAPGFGTTSIGLGEPLNAGSVAEQLVYPLTVAITDTNFIYAYGLVLEDAGHPDGERPYAEFVMLNPSGDTIPCAYFRYEAAEPNGQALPGFYQGTCGAKYKPWTTVGVNLSNYVGQTVTLVITNSDCIWGAHFAQSYWDFKCGILQGSSTADCYGMADTLRAPDDPNISYGYYWYPGGQTTQSIVVYPQAGDTFIVEVQPPTGCNFYEIFVPQVSGLNPAFTYNGSCGFINFHDISTTSTGAPVVAWHWNFPGGNPALSTVQNPVVQYPAGTYTATLIVTAASGCTDTVTVSGITTGVAPVAAFTAADVCFGSNMPFTDQSTSDANDPVAEWQWDFGDGTFSGAHYPVHFFTNDSSYAVTLTVITFSGCVSTTTHTVVVHPVPVALFDANIVCQNHPTIFQNQTAGNGLQWSWDFGDATTSLLQNPSHIYPGSGNFNAELLVTNNFGCRDSITRQVHVNPEPVAVFSASKVCVGDLTCFTDLTTIASGELVTWYWTFGDPASGAANISDEANPCHLFTPGADLNPVYLTVTSDSGCTGSALLTVSFWQLPVASFQSTPACLHTITNFTDLSIATDVEDPLHLWSWDFGDTTFSAVQDPVHTYESPGWFNVQLIVTTNHHCRDTIVSPARVYNTPTPEFSDSAKGCTPFCASFLDLSVCDDGNITDWQWTFSGGNPPETWARNPDVCYNVPGSYNVKLITTSSFGCKDTLMKVRYVDVYEMPLADFYVAPDTLTSLLVPAFNFLDLWSENVTAWQWDFGDGSLLDSNVADPTHSYGASVDNNTYYSYLVTVYVQTENGCRDSITRKVEITPDFSFFVPNTFTPNGDDINDFFYGKGRGITDYTISIYDRWGILIWSCHENGLNTDWDLYRQDGMPSSCQWDGRPDANITHKKLQNDVYVWRVRLTTIFGDVKTYIGHVSAIK